MPKKTSDKGRSPNDDDDNNNDDDDYDGVYSKNVFFRIIKVEATVE